MPTGLTERVPIGPGTVATILLATVPRALQRRRVSHHQRKNHHRPARGHVAALASWGPAWCCPPLGPPLDLAVDHATVTLYTDGRSA